MDKEEIREKALEEAREEVTSEIGRDQLVIKAVKQLEQNEESLNKSVERLRDWYSVHFPELVEAIDDDQTFIEIIEDEARRDELGSFSSLAEESKGHGIGKQDIQIIEETAGHIEHGFRTRESLEEYIEEIMKDEMPNISRILGPLLASKVLALSGGLEDLAQSPASTVQILGAEKAFFRYLSGDGTPPKHGVLFEHRFVSSLPEDRRGKMARFMANKVVMAARVDLYSDKEKGNQYFNEIKEKYQELKED